MIMKTLALLLVFLPLMAVSKTFSVMSYNVQNLFNTKHDKGKEDWTYLPKAFKDKSKEVQEYCESLTNPHYRKNCLEYNWDFKAMKGKIKNLARVIKSYDNGRGPDIVVFQEVENIDVMRTLASKAMKQMGYRYGSLIEGPDSRGIDVGIISRFPVAKRIYHDVELQHRATRGILETILKIGGKDVSVFANHWPSQRNKDETRLAASEVLLEAAQKSKSDIRIAAGDFNTIKTDNPHGIRRNILPYFIDVEKRGRKDSKEKAPGTHWYKGVWSSLDRIFVFKEDLNRVQVHFKTFDIVAHRFMLREYEWQDDDGKNHKAKAIPMSYNVKTYEGFSDHLPVAIKFSTK